MTEEDIKLIEETKKIIEIYKDLDGGMEVIRIQMNTMYKHFKNCITSCDFSNPILLEIFKLERLLENKFLPLNSEPNFDKKKRAKLPRKLKGERDAENLMEYIVYQARSWLSEYHDLKTDALEKQCIDTSWKVKEICEKLGVNQINHCCSEDLSGGVFHCFNFVSIPLKDGTIKNYLVDCTYRQFFTYADSFFERLGIPQNLGPNIGAYMMMTEARKKMAEELLVNGYIELTPDVIKTYFDSFVFSGRNALYYETLGKEVIELSDYEPHYTYEDYLIALNNNGLKNEPYIRRQTKLLESNITFDTLDGIVTKTEFAKT